MLGRSQVQLLQSSTMINTISLPLVFHEKFDGEPGITSAIEILIQIAMGSEKSFEHHQISWFLGYNMDNWSSVAYRIAVVYSVPKSCLTPCNPMDCNAPGFPVLHYVPEFAQTHVYWVGDAIQPSHPLLPFSPSAFNLSQHQRLFQWVGSSHQVAKVLEHLHWSFQRIFRVAFFRIDWLDLLEVQGTLKSLLQHHNSKASILWHSVFFMVQHPYMTTGKTTALTRWDLVGKVMSLLLNMLSRFLIAFLPRSEGHSCQIIKNLNFIFC